MAGAQPSDPSVLYQCQCPLRRSFAGSHTSPPTHLNHADLQVITPDNNYDQLLLSASGDIFTFSEPPIGIDDSDSDSYNDSYSDSEG